MTEKCKICGRPAYPKDKENLCVFHSKVETKSQDFEKAFWEEFEINVEVIDDRPWDVLDYVLESNDESLRKRKTGELNFKEFIFPKEFLERKNKPCFSRVLFKKHTTFEGVTFEGVGAFTNTTFKKEANFRGSKFVGNAIFKDATFSGDANFTDASFQKDADFTAALFLGRVDFKGLGENSVFSEKSPIHFVDVTFEHPEKVSFVSVNLSKTSFKSTNIKDINFVGVDWQTQPVAGMLGFRRVLYDELKEREMPKESRDYALVSEEYKQLRHNYEKNLRFSEYGGDFYIGEMEMRRLISKEKDNWDHPLVLAYKIVSYYGERTLIAAIWIVLTLILFAWFFDLLYQSGLASIQVSVLTFLQQSTPKELGDIDYSKTFLGIAERIISIPLVTLYVLSVRRKFTR